MVSRSATSLVAPITLNGLTALSVLMKIIFFTSFAIAASIQFCVPRTLTSAASNGLYSQIGTCFRAAVWKTRSTFCIARIMRFSLVISPSSSRVLGSPKSRATSCRPVSLLSRTRTDRDRYLRIFFTSSLPMLLHPR